MKRIVLTPGAISPLTSATTTGSAVVRRHSRSSVEKMQNVFREETRASDAWDKVWKSNELPPWSLKGSTPALVHELKHNFDKFVLAHKTSSHAEIRAFVPGCGDGYDLVEIANHCDDLVAKGRIKQASVVGLDISLSAIHHAAQHLEEACEFCPTERPTRVDLVLGDLFDVENWNVRFTFSGAKGCASEQNLSDPYDFVFDYLFFSALHPSQRSLWGSAMNKLLDKNTGRLLTFMFPFEKDRSEIRGAELRGPPYPVTEDDYKDVLNKNTISALTELYENPETIKPRRGREFVCWWKHGVATT